MAIPRRTAAALAAAALALTLAACSASDNPAEGPGSGETPLGRDGVPEPLFTEPGPEAEPGTDTGGGLPSPPVPGSAPPDAGETAWLLTRVGGTDVAAGVDPLRRTGGEFVELTVTLQVRQGSIGLSTLLGLAPSDPGTGDDVDGLSAVELVDAENGRVHRVARDGDGMCVCSQVWPALELAQQDSITLSGTYAAPPEDVDSMTVRLPFGEAFTGVPVV